LFNERLVRDGYAELAVYPPDVKYQARMTAAKQEAKAQARGLWPVCGMVGAPATPTPDPIGNLDSHPDADPIRHRDAHPHCEQRLPGSDGVDHRPGQVQRGRDSVRLWQDDRLVPHLRPRQSAVRLREQLHAQRLGADQVRPAAVSEHLEPALVDAANQWNNSEDDDAVLYNCSGQQVSYFDDGE
jgi:hypothetical protein